MARWRKYDVHPLLDTDALRALANSAHQAYLLAAALQIDTPADALLAVLHNEETIYFSRRGRQELVIDEDYPVSLPASMAVAERRGLPRDVAEFLANEADLHVAELAFRNRAMPVRLLPVALDRESPDWPYLLFALTQNPKSPADLLAVVAERGDEQTQVEVVVHPNTSDGTLRALAMSEHARVRAEVARNPRADDADRAFGVLSQE